MASRRFLMWGVLGSLLFVVGAPAASGERPLDSDNDANTGRDAGDRLGEATPIVEGTYVGGLGAFDWEDWYAFDAPPGTHVCVTWRGIPLLLVVSVWPGGSLFDERGATVPTAGCTDSAIMSKGFESGAGGRFYLRFTSHSLARYEFTLNVDPCGSAGLHDGAAAPAATGNATVSPPPPPPPPPAPVLRSVTPERGAPGTALQLAGSSFSDGAHVRVGDIAARLLRLDADSAEAVLPDLPPGLHDVTVTNPDGQSARLAAAFEVTLTADPAVVPGDLVVERRSVTVEGRDGVSTPLDMRLVRVTVHNLGYGATTEPTRVEVWAEPVGRLVPTMSNRHFLGTATVAAGFEADASVRYTFAWDPKAPPFSAGDYVVRAVLLGPAPELTRTNNEVAVEHTIAVSGLGGL